MYLFSHRQLGLQNCTTPLMSRFPFILRRNLTDYDTCIYFLFLVGFAFLYATLPVALPARPVCIEEVHGRRSLAAGSITRHRSSCMPPPHPDNHNKRTKRYPRRCPFLVQWGRDEGRKGAVDVFGLDSSGSSRAGSPGVLSSEEIPLASGPSAHPPQVSFLCMPWTHNIQTDLHTSRTERPRLSHDGEDSGGKGALYDEQRFLSQCPVPGEGARIAERRGGQGNGTRLFGSLRRAAERERLAQKRSKGVLFVSPYAWRAGRPGASEDFLRESFPPFLSLFSYTEDEGSHFLLSSADPGACTDKLRSRMLEGERKTKERSVAPRPRGSFAVMIGEEQSAAAQEEGGRAYSEDFLGSDTDEGGADQRGAKEVSERNSEPPATRRLLASGERPSIKKSRQGEDEAQRANACSTSESCLLPTPSPRYHEHIPVMKEKTVSLLITDPSGFYVDCTAGGGGHSSTIWRAIAPYVSPRHS